MPTPDTQVGHVREENFTQKNLVSRIQPFKLRGGRISETVRGHHWSPEVTGMEIEHQNTTTG